MVFCDRARTNPTLPEEDQAEFAQEAWNESQAILDALDVHICNLDNAIIYMTREYIHKCVYSWSCHLIHPELITMIDSICIAITGTLRRLVPAR